MNALNIVVRVGDLQGAGAPVARAEAAERDVRVTREDGAIRIRLPTAEMTIPIDAAGHFLMELERAVRQGGFEMSSDFFTLKGSK